MKKSIAIVCLLLLVLVAALYFFVPAAKTESFLVNVHCTDDAAMRQIIDQEKWTKWWPGKRMGKNVFTFQSCTYTIDKIKINGFDATIHCGSDSAKINMQVFPSGTDAAQFIWTTAFTFGTNPFKRTSNYFGRTAVTKNVWELAAAVRNYFKIEKNIYGMTIVEQEVSDSSLIALKQTFSHYPSIPEVYAMIGSIEEYIKKKSGEEVSYPMLNVHQETPTAYNVMVAIPTGKDLPAEGNFLLRKMVLGNILMGEVKGGLYTVAQGEQELENYVADYKKVAPAIPFQSLVTNRMQEQDTAKWITRLYYPVLN